MKSPYSILRASVKSITSYYLLLVEETKSQRLVGSTNEWVLDNYYMVSEQEKVLREELRPRALRLVAPSRIATLMQRLDAYLDRCHCAVDKRLLFRFLSHSQKRSGDYLSYPEVYALLPLLKLLLLRRLAELCDTMRTRGAHHYSPTDKEHADSDYLERAAQENLMMMNLWMSLRKLTRIPLSEVIEAVSHTERLLAAEKAGMYDRMQDRTKEDYRNRIVRLCRRQRMDEHTLVQQLLEEAGNTHIGFLLFPPRRWNLRARIYILVVVVAAAVLATLIAAGQQPTAASTWLLTALLLLLPMSQLAIDLFNWLLGKLHHPRGTFKLRFKDGIVPTQYTTMVIMPTILKNKARVDELFDTLEVYYLSNLNRGDGKVGECVSADTPATNALTHSHINAFNNIHYTLVGDAAAYGEEDAPWDDEVAAAGLARVEALNRKYPNPTAPIFNFVYRRRAWSDSEQTWLGWERKRGAILHTNDLLLGRSTREEIGQRFRAETLSHWIAPLPSPASLPSNPSAEAREPDEQTLNSQLSAEAREPVERTLNSHSPIRFVITLDTDTELVLYSAQKLIGAMAHPLNVAQLSPDGRRVDRGYGIMQPRVNVDVEVTNKSRYAQLMAGLGGLDVYTTASFELYQDIFNEGSFCGKGIYDLRVFQKVLKGTFPENLILSHDLLEGSHIRCGLINDVELFDDNPSNYIDDAKRHHRWTRGDWQIISWLGRRVRNQRGEHIANPVSTIARWKIFDNLRRSLLSLALLVALLAGFAALTSIHPAWMLLATLLAVASPILFFIIGQITSLPRFGRRYKYYTTLLRGFNVVVQRSLVQFAILPKEAWMYTDAAVRACWRMWVSKRHLLAWITSDEAAKSTKGTLGDYLGKFWFNYVCAAAVVALSALHPAGTMGWVAAAICALMWCAAPLLMYRLGKKFPQDKKTLSPQQTEEMRQVALDTWHYFDTLCTPATHYLIPDNYQQGREPLTDYKTSPTNIGYSLTAIVSACSLSFITRDEAEQRIAHIVDTLERLEKWNGHLFNWYDTHTLQKLPNYFVSTADSGNLVASLYAVKGFLVEGELRHRVDTLIRQTDFSRLYNPELDVFSIGFDYGSQTLLPYHYNNFASEARLTSFLTIAQGDAPYKHWFCLDKTLVQYKGYKGVASWYGTMFEYFMPLIFLPTYRHTLMDETYSFAIRAQRAFIDTAAKGLPWGISETAYNELDDARNYKYHAFGVPYLKFQNTTPDRIVVSPYSSIMAIGIDDRAVYDNLQRLRRLDMYDPQMGFFESYDEEDHVPIYAHYAHHQGMILASLANYLADHCIQRCFMSEPAMRSMETLLKEKAQVKPYIDLKVTRYKRYRYSKVQTESDARDYDSIARVPEIGVVSNGQYTVLMNDRGSGFSRYKNILVNRYRKISADHYGCYLYIRDLRSDRLWCATYAPLDVMPENYHVSFASDKLLYQRTDNGVSTKTEVTVLKDRAAELRRYTFNNHTDNDIDLELTTYGEVILAPAAEDENHRVFAGMKLLSEYDAEHEALLFNRPANTRERHYLLHRLWVADSSSLGLSPVEYETSRLRFLGRGGSIRHADVIDSRRTLSGTVGTTLDPVMCMRRRIHIPAGRQVEAYVITAFAKSRESLLQLCEQYRSAMDVEHAFQTASVFNNMRTSLSLLKGAQMRLYGSIAKYLAQTATLGDGRNDLLAHNTLSQSGLWRFGISGDLAIVLMEIDSAERSGHAKELLRAFEYYKVHGLQLDLVFINDAPAADREGLTHFIRSMADTEHLWAEHSEAGKVYIIDGTLLSDAERTLLRTVARLTFNTASGLRIEEQLAALEQANQHYQDKVEYPVMKAKKDFRVWSDLEFYNQYGGFDRNGRDYVVTNTNTPMPWVNVVSNPRFGCIVSSTMAGFTFAYNAQQFKLTGWSNDIVRDNASEMLLIDRQQFVPATARHGQGFSAFDAEYDGLRVEVRLFVALERMEKYYQIRLVNLTDAPRDLQLDMVYKLVLGQCEEQTARYLHSEWDQPANTLRVRNVYHPIYSNQELRLTATEPLTDISLHSPNRKRIGLTVHLEPQATHELAYIIAVGEQGTPSAPLHTTEELYAEFNRVAKYWEDRLDTIQVHTPDRSFDYMLNRWYLYQVYASRLFARAGFYQVGGATGYRDQLQDVMSVLYSDPAYARRQILDHAAHQMAEGDVLHWWHESMHLGARTTFSDDYLWLIYVTYQYVTVTGDRSILDERVPFCQCDPLSPGENERGMHYTVPAANADGTFAPEEPAFEYASLYEHLRRAVGRSMGRLGQHGLPLMGCGDWNDGMSQVGAGGKGESVWVAFFLCDLLPKMEQLTQMATDADLSYCADLSHFRSRLVDALHHHAWDGQWYLRAFFDDGTPMGSLNSTECQIDLISQAWSILTHVATEEQKDSVFRETDRRLVNREHEIVQLLTPPFSRHNPTTGAPNRNPGYIANYPEGVRENGGQYTHGAMWYIMAQLQEGRTDMGYFLYSLINPIHRTQSLAEVLKYKVEPYCIAADIYSNRQHPGRGGWTWYTGSASWAYKTGIESILGLTKRADRLTFAPHVPSEWPGFSIDYRYGNTLYHLHYTRRDGEANPHTEITLVDDGQEHTIEI